MNTEDNRYINNYWHNKTNKINQVIDDAFAECQTHAYELGLKRGLAEARALAIKFKAAQAADDPREWAAVIADFISMADS